MMNLVARGLVGCLCVFGTGLAQAGINSWSTTGPQGGSFADLERSSTVPGTVYATLGHSFYRSLDGGRTWSAAYPLGAQTADIAVDPTNGRRVYVAVVDKGVFRSEDAGRTFVQVASSFSAWSVAVGGTDGATVYYSGQNVFARSTDRGNTWTTQSTPFNTATTLLVIRRWTVDRELSFELPHPTASCWAKPKFRTSSIFSGACRRIADAPAFRSSDSC